MNYKYICPFQFFAKLKRQLNASISAASKRVTGTKNLLLLFLSSFFLFYFLLSFFFFCCSFLLLFSFSSLVSVRRTLRYGCWKPKKDDHLSGSPWCVSPERAWRLCRHNHYDSDSTPQTKALQAVTPLTNWPVVPQPAKPQIKTSTLDSWRGIRHRAII